jgi:biotin carboxyl carrier protein
MVEVSRIEVRAEMTGTVALRHVDDGARVERGDTIAEVECMKTFWPVYAPVGGIVRHKVELGEVVGQDEVIAIIETGP